MMHDPTTREKYRLKREKQRLSRHFKAFQNYYQIKEKPCLRLIRGLTKKHNRLGKLIRKCETRLDVGICRLGWCSNIKVARL